jgi:hypothetical protein
MIQRLAFVAALSVAVSVDGFAMVSTVARRESSILQSSRREILEYSAAAILGSAFVGTPAVFAEGFDDLSMPSAEEQKQTEVRFMMSRQHHLLCVSHIPPALDSANDTIVLSCRWNLCWLFLACRGKIKELPEKAGSPSPVC